MRKTILWIIGTILFVFLLITCGYFILNKPQNIPNEEKKEIVEENKEPVITNLTISAVGDCTLGNDSKVGNGWNNFNSYLKNDDYSYYFKEVYDVLNKDDITIANLEGTFTEETEKAIKIFNFKNTKDYINVLTEGSVEIVNLANNHTYDYKDKGYADTIAALDEYNLSYFGYENYTVKDIKGIKIGFAGLNYYDERNYENYEKHITKVNL